MTAYSAKARVSGQGPAARWRVSNTTARAARVMGSRPRVDSPGAGWAWLKTRPATVPKPARARMGHHQRATDPATRRGRGLSSTRGFQPGNGWPQPGAGLQPGVALGWRVR